SLVIILILSGCHRRFSAMHRNPLAMHQPVPTVADSTPATTYCPATKTILDEPPKDPNADRFGFGEWYVNRHHTIWVRRQPWRDGNEGNKVIWMRPAGTKPAVTGRRLGGRVPPLRVQMPCCYPTGFQVTGLIFPAGGCWEITAKAGTSGLRFVTEVVKDQSSCNRLQERE